MCWVWRFSVPSAYARIKSPPWNLYLRKCPCSSFIIFQKFFFRINELEVLAYFMANVTLWNSISSGRKKIYIKHIRMGKVCRNRYIHERNRDFDAMKTSNTSSGWKKKRTTFLVITKNIKYSEKAGKVKWISHEKRLFDATIKQKYIYMHCTPDVRKSNLSHVHVLYMPRNTKL